MKTLLLLRHAKAEHQLEGQTDHERDLAERGAEEAPRIGHWLVEHQLVPASLLSSSAIRARRTAEIVADACQFAGQVETFKELYLASPETYLRVIRAAAPQADRVMVVGHNPTLDELLFMLCGEHEGFPTAGLATVELNVDSWDDVHLPRTYRLAHFVRGKKLE